jgi:ATP-binding cassette, subfamily C, bacterial PrsD
MKTSRRPLVQVRRAMLVATTLSAVSSAFMLGLPVVALQLTESAIPAGAANLIAILAGITAALVAMSAVIDLFREVVLVRAAVWLDHTMGLRVVETAIGDDANGRTIGARADAVEALGEALSGGRLNGLAELPWSILACAAVALIDPLLGLVCLVCLVAMGASIALFASATANRSTKSAKHRAEARRWLGTLAANPALLSQHGLAAGAGQRWELLNRGHVANAYAAGLRLGFGRVWARALSTGGTAVMLGAGAYLAVEGAVPAGAALAAMLVTARALGTLEHVAANWDGIRAARRAWRLLQEGEGRAVDVSIDVKTAGAGHIIITGAACGYAGQTTPVLSGIQLAIAPGSALGVIGAEGAGKSAFAALVAGVHRPISGRAEIDGIAIALAQRSPGGAPIGYLSDDPRIVEGSVLQNIAGFRKDAEAAALEAAGLAGVDDIIAGLPGGFATQTGPDGSAVPLRIRRAVALARAVCGPRRFVVLDQPETGLDDAGLQRLEDMLVRLRVAGIGVLLATSEPRLLRLTDQVAVLAGGIVETVMPAAQFAATVASAAGSSEREWPRQVA